MDEVTFIQNTASDELIKHHLKLVFTTYHRLYGEVCTGCPAKITGYIKRIKNYQKTERMSSITNSGFALKDRSVIVMPGSNKAYSNANITDEVAIAFLKKNPNRKVLFSKVPHNLEQLMNPAGPKTTEKEITENRQEIKLEDYTVAELRALFPEAKGRSKQALIASIQELQDSYTDEETILNDEF